MLLAPSTAAPSTTILLCLRSPSRGRRSWPLALLRLLAIQFPHVHALVEIAQQVLAEIVGANPREVLRLGPIRVALARQNHEIEPLVGLDQRIRQAERV